MPFSGILKTSELNTIILDDNNAEVRLKSKDAGNYIQCELLDHSDRSNNEFILSGEGSENYEIDYATAPQILCNVLKRPIQAAFYNVFKEYDGTTELDPEMLIYDLLPTSSEESGIVEGSNSDIEGGYCYPVSVEIKDGGYNYYYTNVSSFTLPQWLLTLALKQDQGMNHLFEDGAYFSVWGSSSKSGYTDKFGINSLSVGLNEGTAVNVLKINIKECRYTSQGLMPNDGKSSFSIIVKDPSNTCVNFPKEIATYSNQARGAHTLDSNMPEGKWSLVNTRNSALYNGGGLAIRINFNIVMPTSSNSDKRAYPEYIESDRFKVWINKPSNNITFSTKNATDEFLPLVFPLNLSLGGPSGKNYTLENVQGYGRITKRRIDTITIIPQPKIYDGTTTINCKIIGSRMLEEDDAYFEDSINIVSQHYPTDWQPNLQHNATDNIRLLGADANNYVMSQSDVQSKYNGAGNIIQLSGPTPVIPRKITLDIQQLIISVINNVCKFYWAYNINNIVDINDVVPDLDTISITLDNGKRVKIGELQDKLAVLTRMSDDEDNELYNDFEISFGSPIIGKISTRQVANLKFPEYYDADIEFSENCSANIGRYTVNDVIQGVSAKCTIVSFPDMPYESFKVYVKDRLIFEGDEDNNTFTTSPVIFTSKYLSIELTTIDGIQYFAKFGDKGSIESNLGYDLSEMYGTNYKCPIRLIHRY